MIILESVEKGVERCLRKFDVRVGRPLFCKNCGGEDKIKIYDIKKGGPYCSLKCFDSCEVGELGLTYLK